MENNFIIVQDTRENQPWDFSFYGIDKVRKTLKTGDYTLLGYEDKLCIERKKSTGELATNLGTKSKQFWAELNRMKDYQYRYLILEFSRDTLSKFPLNSGIPRKYLSKLRMNSNYMISCLDRIENDYDITVIFSSSVNEAVEEAINIFNIVANNNDRPTIF